MRIILVIAFVSGTPSTERHASMYACEMARREVVILAGEAVRWSYCYEIIQQTPGPGPMRIRATG